MDANRKTSAHDGYAKSGGRVAPRMLRLSRFATIMTSHCGCIGVSFGFLVIPFLIGCLPDFFLAAIATLKGSVDIELRLRPICIEAGLVTRPLLMQTKKKRLKIDLRD